MHDSNSIRHSWAISHINDLPPLPRSYGFVVYTDPNLTDPACAGLNGLKMGDRTLTVRRAAEVRDRGRVTPAVLQGS